MTSSARSLGEDEAAAVAADGATNVRLVLRDMPFYAVANGSLAVAGFLGLALFTRSLSTAEYGLYALTLTTATMAEAVLFSWVNNATLRYLPGHENEGTARVFLATNFIVSCGLLIIVSLLWVMATLVVGLRAPALASTFQVGVLVLASRVFFGFAVGLVRARRQTARYAVYTALSAFGAVLLPAALHVTLGTGANGILYMASIAAAIPAAIELIRCKSLGWIRPRLFLATVAKRSATYGVPLAGAAFGAAVLSVADRYMLQYFRGPSEVGSYTAGYDLADKSLKLVLTVLIASTFPVVMEVVSRQGREEANRLINRIMRVYLVWMVPVTVAVIAFRHALVNLVLGPGFGSAVSVIPWVAVGTLCWGATQIVAQVFQVHERTAPLLYWLLAAAAVNTVLNFWLIPSMGAKGAALATTGGYVFYLAALWHGRVRSPTPVVTMREAAIVAAGGAAMLAVIITVPLDLGSLGLSPIAKLTLGLGTYAIVLRILGTQLFDELVRGIRAGAGLVRGRVPRIQVLSRSQPGASPCAQKRDGVDVTIGG